MGCTEFSGGTVLFSVPIRKGAPVMMNRAYPFSLSLGMSANLDAWGREFALFKDVKNMKVLARAVPLLPTRAERTGAQRLLTPA